MKVSASSKPGFGWPEGVHRLYNTGTVISVASDGRRDALAVSLFPLFYFPSALMKAGFPLLSPVEAIQPAKRKLCLALRLRAVVRVACAERAGC